MNKPAGVRGYFFFFNDTATTEIYTLSLHDALPICRMPRRPRVRLLGAGAARSRPERTRPRQRRLRAVRHVRRPGRLSGGPSGHGKGASLPRGPQRRRPRVRDVPGAKSGGQGTGARTGHAGEPGDRSGRDATRTGERDTDHADQQPRRPGAPPPVGLRAGGRVPRGRDRKSTRLNSSHSQISYAVFCLKKKTPHNSNLPHHLTVTHQERVTTTVKGMLKANISSTADNLLRIHLENFFQISCTLTRSSTD